MAKGLAKETTVVPLAFPLGGVNRNLPRSFQPPGTAWDALNVLPYDRYGRARGGQRPGTGKLWAAAIGSGTSFIQSLDQATIALDPATVTASTQLFSEPFTYANGNLGTVGSANWEVRVAASSNYATSFNGAVTVGGFVVTSNAISKNGADAAACARYINTPLAVGTAYLIRMTYKANSAEATQRQIELVSRLGSAGTFGTGAVGASFTINSTNGITSISLTTSAGVLATTAIPAGSIVATTDHILELQVNGNVFKAVVDGITYVTTTNTTAPSQVGVGFQASGNTLILDTFQVFAGAQLTSYRQTHLVAVSNGSIYDGDIATQGTIAAGGTAALSTVALPGVASLFGLMFFVDGFTAMKQLDLTTRIVSTPTIVAGGSPSETATTLGQYTLACSWRGRLVLGADRTNPQNFVMSKAGSPLNFDYSDTTPIAAVAGNASLAGKIGDPITALIPFSDDILIVGGDHTIWAIKGDLADGGSIDIVSDSIGILGARSWCKTPEGVIYFLGTGGLYRMTPGGIPENISSTKFNQFFANINRTTNYLSMAWDRDRHGCYVFVTPVTSGTATHVWVDARTDGGYWPLTFPNETGPVCCLVYDGDSSNDRRLLLGGRAGYIQIMSESSRRDDGGSGANVAISSYVWLGPFQPYGADGEAVIVKGTLDMGELNTADFSASIQDQTRWNANVNVYGGDSAYSVTEGVTNEPTVYPQFTEGTNFGNSGYQQTWYPRIRGRWLSARVSNTDDGSYWSFERLAFDVRPGGKQR